MMTKRKYKICFFTGTRAEYGLLKYLMKQISDSDDFVFQLIVTGSHLSKKHGYTVKEIIEDGFKIDSKIDINLNNDSDISICKSIGKLIPNISDAFSKLQPDLIFLLGDRYELMGACLSATIFRIPIAHIHGGEKTVGAFDDCIRHAITKLSHIHFVANDVYRKRVIQLGENQKYVFNVGGLGVDAIHKTKLLSKESLERILGLKFMKKNLIITYHPLTLADKEDSIKEITELLKALSLLEDTLQIFTMPNADPGNDFIFKVIKKYVKNNKFAYSFSSLGQLNYYSCLRQIDALVGNSSSGILEAPSFNIGTINIGDRQKGRLEAKSVISIEANAKLIKRSIDKLYSKEFSKILKNNLNPYGNGQSSKKIIQIIKNINFDNVLKKNFYDINF